MNNPDTLNALVLFAVSLGAALAFIIDGTSDLRKLGHNPLRVWAWWALWLPLGVQLVLTLIFLARVRQLLPH